MDPRYARPSSPGSRRLANPMRSSTGTAVYPSAYDDYYPPPRASREIITSPRSTGDRLAAPRIMTKNYKDDGPPTAKFRNDYMTRPRRPTLETEPAGIRKPLSVIPPSSPNRVRPVITSTLERTSGQHVKSQRSSNDEDYYVLPASSGSQRDHRRGFSADTEDLARLTTGDREVRDRMWRGGYRSSGMGDGRQGYRLNGPLVRHQDTDGYDGYSYTDPREQMYRDTAPRPRPRRDSYDGGRRERPLSMTGLDDYLPRIPTASREIGPPPSTRGFDKIGRSESLRQGSRAAVEGLRPRDYAPQRSEEMYDIPKRKPSTRKPVSLHQTNHDDGYESYREDHDDPRERHRHVSRYDEDIDRRDFGARAESKAYPVWDDDDDDRNGVRTKPRRDRDHRRKEYGDEEPFDRDRPDRESREKSKRDGEMLVAGLAGGLSGGLAAEEGKDRDRRRNEGREKESRESRESSIANEETHDRDRHKKKPVDKGGQDGDTSGEERRERRRRRRREREALEREREGRDPRDEILRERSPYEQDTRDRDSNEEEQRRRNHHHQQDDSREKLSHGERSEGEEPVELKDERPRTVGVMSPAREKDPEPPVKSILRPPREKFPEDPAPVREGVAPLKDAGKKGIPPNARWTKIDRKLVNPEALEEGNERYEERIDYVIVLRVLTKEEIQNYALRTQEIRGKREQNLH